MKQAEENLIELHSLIQKIAINLAILIMELNLTVNSNNFSLKFKLLSSIFSNFVIELDKDIDTLI